MLSEAEAKAIMKGIGGAVGPHLREIRDELRAIRRREDSTGQLLADLDMRLAAIEDMLAERER